MVNFTNNLNGREMEQVIKQNINNRSIIVCNFSNRLESKRYIDIFCKIHNLEILQYYVFQNERGTAINLYDYLSVDLCMTNIPILYFVDNYIDIKDNSIWFKNRINLNDIIVDKNLNITKVFTLENNI